MNRLGAAMERHRTPVFLASLALLFYGLLCFARFPIERDRALSLPQYATGELSRRQLPHGKHVRITGLRPASRGFALRRDAMSPGDVEAFVPFFAAASAHPEPSDLWMILEVRDGDAWQRIRDGDVLDLVGLVAGPERLEDWVRKDLSAKYPGISFSDPLVFVIGLHEPTVAKADGLRRHGLIAFALSALGFVGVLFRRSLFGGPPPARP